MNYSELFVTNNLPDSLSNEELYECFKRYEAGDQEAKNKIIEHNIRLVFMAVNRFKLVPYEKKELMAVGLEGLVKSVNTFDINKGFKFSTYASRVINNEILLFMRKNKKHNYNMELEQTLTTDHDGNELELLETLSDQNSDFVSDYENKEVYAIIREFVGNLPDKERQVIMMYYGFIDDKTYSQKEIAEVLKMTQSGVSRIRIKAVRKLKSYLIKTDIVDRKQEENNVKRKRMFR